MRKSHHPTFAHQYQRFLSEQAKLRKLITGTVSEAILRCKHAPYLALNTSGGSLLSATSCSDRLFDIPTQAPQPFGMYDMFQRRWGRERMRDGHRDELPAAPT